MKSTFYKFRYIFTTVLIAFVLVQTAMAQEIQVVSSPTLVADWRFNVEEYDGSAGEVIDSESGINGRSINDAEIEDDGKYCEAASFDGDDDYILIDHDDDLLLNNGSIAFWMQTADLDHSERRSHGGQGILSKDAGGNGTGGHLTMWVNENGSIELRMQSTTDSYSITSAANLISNDTWAHVTLTWGTLGLKLYVDGTLVGSDAFTGGLGPQFGAGIGIGLPPAGNKEPLVFGASTWSSDDLQSNHLRDYYQGAIDEVRFYDGALSADEIATVMGESNACSGEQDVTITFFESDGTTPIEDAEVYIWDEDEEEYESLGTTDEDGKVEEEVDISDEEYHSFRIEYLGRNKDLRQNVLDNSVVAFQTVNVTLELRDSDGDLLTGGAAYYWDDEYIEIDSLETGQISVEFLPQRTNIRLYHRGVRQDKTFGFADSTTATFNTVDALFELRDSNGDLQEGGVLNYWADGNGLSGYQRLDSLAGGQLQAEMLPVNLGVSFDHKGLYLRKHVDLEDSTTAVFNTVNAIVSLNDSQGNPLNDAYASYYGGGKNFIDSLQNGQVEIELLPIRFQFLMNYRGVETKKNQDIGLDPQVQFSTRNVVIELRDSEGNLSGDAYPLFWGGSDQVLDSLVDGRTHVELSPNRIPFRMDHRGVRVTENFRINESDTVTFYTAPAEIRVEDCFGSPLDSVEIAYNAWRIGYYLPFDTTDASGTVNSEFMPVNQLFFAKWHDQRTDQKLNLAEDSVLAFKAGRVVSNDITRFLVGNWRDFESGMTFMPGEYKFEFTDGSQTKYTVVSGETLNLPGNTSTECVDIDRADLSLTASVSEAAPDSGSTVTYRFVAYNAGEDAATGVEVRIAFDADQLTKDSGTGDGAWSINGTWNIGYLAVGDSAVYSLIFNVNTSGVVILTGEVSASDQEDPDSDVNNGDVSEDDYFSLTITGGQATGGGGAGLESNGNLALALGQRMFMQHRRGMPAAKYEASRGIMFSSERPLLVAAGVGGFTETGILDLIPTSGPESTTALSVTPHDLIGVTNARSVVAVDYNREDNRRLAGIFGVSTSPDTLYEHTKVVCDRLIGATLESVEVVEINGQPFVLTQLRHPNGQLDYAITFLAIRNGTGYEIDSRFTQNEYDLPAGDELLTFQVWSVSKSYTRGLVDDIVTAMDEGGTLTYNNAGTAPQVFVREGHFKNGVLTLDMVNPIGAHDISITGSVAYVEGGIRDFVETIAGVKNPSSGSQTVQLEIDLGSVFDASLILSDSNGVFDQLYYSDGQWGYNFDPEGASISAFSSELGSAPDAEGSYNVQRSASLTGEVTTWVSMYRFLQPGGQPIDLEHYAWIEFKASGIGSFELVVAREGIEDWSAQYRTNFDLDQEEITYQINLDKLTSIAGAPEFASHDITMLSFNPISDGDSTIAFDLNISEVRFGGYGTVAIEDDSRELPDSYDLDQNYPNPFNPVTNIQFALPENTTASVVIYDMLGRRIKVLASGNFSAGVHTVQFDGAQLASGIYFYRLETPNFTKTKKMIMIK